MLVASGVAGSVIHQRRSARRLVLIQNSEVAIERGGSGRSLRLVVQARAADACARQGVSSRSVAQPRSGFVCCCTDGHSAPPLTLLGAAEPLTAADDVTVQESHPRPPEASGLGSSAGAGLAVNAAAVTSMAIANTANFRGLPMSPTIYRTPRRTPSAPPAVRIVRSSLQTSARTVYNCALVAYESDHIPLATTRHMIARLIRNTSAASNIMPRSRTSCLDSMILHRNNQDPITP